MDVKLPDGTVVKNIPEGTSKADLVAKLKANGMNVPDSWSTPAPSQEPSMVDKLKGIAGSLYGPLEAVPAMTSAAIAKPVSDVAGLGGIAANAMGMTNQDPAAIKAGVQNAMTYQPRTQAGQDTTNLIGKIGDSTLGVASRYVGGKAGQGATALGASPDVAQGVQNGVTEAGNQLPNLLGTKLPSVGAGNIANAAKTAITSAPRQAALQAAHDAGYMIPPAEMLSAPVGKTLTGVAGKDQINRGFSIANQNVTNQLAAKDLGVPADVPFDQAAVARVKSNANAVYDTVKKADQTQIPVKSSNGMVTLGPDGKPLTQAAGPVISDPQFTADVKAIGADRANPTYGTGNDEAIAKLKANLNQPTVPTEDLVNKIKTLRQDARTNLNATDDVEKQALGRAQQQGADALESQFDRYLQNTGQPGLLKAFQSARTTLAKAKTVEDAMSADGHVDAAAINKYRNSGGYVDGNLKSIADAADTIGNVVKNTSKVSPPEPFSKMQFLASLGGLSAGGGQVAGHAGALGGAAAGTLMAGPSLARALIGSGKYQAAMGGQVPQASVLSRLAASPASPLAGLAVPNGENSN